LTVTEDWKHITWRKKMQEVHVQFDGKEWVWWTMRNGLKSIVGQLQNRPVWKLQGAIDNFVNVIGDEC
jgi:hypothetical protein